MFQVNASSTVLYHATEPTVPLFDGSGLNAIRLHYFLKRLEKSRMVMANYQVTTVGNSTVFLSQTQQTVNLIAAFVSDICPHDQFVFMDQLSIKLRT
jgi:hypothetical protein